MDVSVPFAASLVVVVRRGSAGAGTDGSAYRGPQFTRAPARAGGRSSGELPAPFQNPVSFTAHNDNVDSTIHHHVGEGEGALSTLYRNVTRNRRVPHRRTVVFATTVALCVSAALLVGVCWSVGNKLQAADAVNSPPAAAAWNGSNGLITTTSETDAQSLRADGWTLPTLASEGYQVESMVQGDVAGQPMVAITLVNDHHRVQVIEQRGDVNPDNPLDGVTGLPVSAEGPHESAVEGTQLWVVRSEPWRAVMARDDVVYTVMTDASPSTLSRTLTLVAAEERGRVTLPGTETNGFGATVLDGLREIIG